MRNYIKIKKLIRRYNILACPSRGVPKLENI